MNEKLEIEEAISRLWAVVEGRKLVPRDTVHHLKTDIRTVLTALAQTPLTEGLRQAQADRDALAATTQNLQSVLGLLKTENVALTTELAEAQAEVVRGHATGKGR